MKLHAVLIAVSCACGSVYAADYPAVLDWSGRVTLAMSVPGVFESVQVQPGQQVKKGQLLAALNPTQYKAAVAEAKADVDRLVLEEADGKRDLDRVKELYARTVSATTELDASELRYSRAVANLAMAQARLEKARRQLEESELRAPFNARILQRFVEPGAVAASLCQPSPVFSVAGADEFVARATLQPAQAAQAKMGRKAEVLANGTTIGSEIRALSYQPDGKLQIEVAIPQRESLLPGQAVTIRLK